MMEYLKCPVALFNTSIPFHFIPFSLLPPWNCKSEMRRNSNLHQLLIWLSFSGKDSARVDLNFIYWWYQAKLVLGLSPKLRLCDISRLQLQHSFRVTMNKVSLQNSNSTAKLATTMTKCLNFSFWWSLPVIIFQAASSSIDSRWGKHLWNFIQTSKKGSHELMSVYLIIID